MVSQASDSSGWHFVCIEKSASEFLVEVESLDITDTCFRKGALRCFTGRLSSW